MKPAFTDDPVEEMVNPAVSYFSVILWPVEKKHNKIVTPAPVTHSPLVGPHTTILKIPFNGVYWYFQSPNQRPEPDAHVVHGSPLKISVDSTNWLPIIMQARQVLPSPINLDCCSQIRVAIKNGDNRPGIISLGVILTNTTRPGKPSIFLRDENPKVPPSSK